MIVYVLGECIKKVSDPAVNLLAYLTAYIFHQCVELGLGLGSDISYSYEGLKWTTLRDTIFYYLSLFFKRRVAGEGQTMRAPLWGSQNYFYPKIQFFLNYLLPKHRTTYTYIQNSFLWTKKKSIRKMGKVRVCRKHTSVI